MGKQPQDLSAAAVRASPAVPLCRGRRVNCSGTAAERVCRECLCAVCVHHPAETLHPIGSSQIISHRPYSSDPFIFPSHLQAFDRRRLEEREKNPFISRERSHFMFLFLCIKKELIHKVLMFYLILQQFSLPTVRVLIRSTELNKTGFTPL